MGTTLLAGWLAIACLAAAPAAAYEANPFVVELDIPGPGDEEDSAGGIVVADVDDDGKMDFLVTCRGHRKLWVARTDIGVGGSSERQGLPGHHGPGVAAGDTDGDGRCEVVFLTRDSVVHVVDGATGKEKGSAKPPVPKGAERWELAMIADFRGKADDGDVLLQATNAKGYRTGRYLAAYAIDALLKGGRPLWTTDRFGPCAHNGARLADLDGDGRDEVLGETILGPTGKLLAKAAPHRGHLDSLFVADVLPGRPGLEIIVLEEGGGDSNCVQVFGAKGPLWRSHFKRQEPHDAVFVWCRSRYNTHQKPFVFDAAGRKVFDYAMDDVAPKGWTASGVEVIHTIDWTGERHQLACAKERHTAGDVCVFEPLTGRFVEHFRNKADRLYVADVTGDWREEIVVLAGSRLHVYHNPKPNPRPDEKRLWTSRNYRRLKHCHNYYSP